MKLREFWLYFCQYNFPLRVSQGERLHKKHIQEQEYHVREVSPALDAAYAECEKVLKNSADKNRLEGVIHVELINALDALRKARE